MQPRYATPASPLFEDDGCRYITLSHSRRLAAGGFPGTEKATLTCQKRVAGYQTTSSSPSTTELGNRKQSRPHQVSVSIVHQREQGEAEANTSTKPIVFMLESLTHHLQIDTWIDLAPKMRA